MTVKVASAGTKASVEVDLRGPGPVSELEGAAVSYLSRTFDEGDLAPARAALDRSWRDFIVGVLGGFYADGRSADEIRPVYRVLMAVYGVAKEGYSSVEEECRIVDEEGSE